MSPTIQNTSHDKYLKSETQQTVSFESIYHDKKSNIIIQMDKHCYIPLAVLVDIPTWSI